MKEIVFSGVRDLVTAVLVASGILTVLPYVNQPEAQQAELKVEYTQPLTTERLGGINYNPQETFNELQVTEDPQPTDLYPVQPTYQVQSTINPQ